MAGKGAELAAEWQSLLDEAGISDAKPLAPQHTAAASGVAGFGQGISSGFTDELGAAVDTAISKVPGVRSLAESLNSMGGGHPGLSPLDRDIPYQQRVAEYRQRNRDMRDQHPVATTAGQALGTVAQSFAPGIGAATAPTKAGMALSGAVQGAAAGAGFNERPEDLPRDMSLGAGTGAVAGTLGGVAQRYAAGAPARNDARQLTAFGVSPKTAGKATARPDGSIASRSDEVIGLLRKSPGIKAAAGDPRRVVEAVTESMAPLSKRTGEIYAKTDKAAKAGGAELPEMLGPLNKLRSAAEGKGASPQYRNRINGIIDQVINLAEEVPGVATQKGSVAKSIPTQKLRQFISDQLAPTAHESQTGAAQAVDDAAVALKDALRGFVGKQLGAGTAKELEAAERDISTHLVVKEAALRQFDKGRYSAPTPKPLDAAKRAVGAGVDAVIGAGGSKPARTLEEGARRLTVQKFTEALDADDREAGIKALQEGIFGAQ